MRKVVKLRQFFVVILILVPSSILGFMGKPVEMGFAIVAGAIAATFMNLDKFAEFKGAGFEAKLKTIVKDAEFTIENLKKVAIPIIAASMNTIITKNRFVSDSFFVDNKKMFLPLKEVAEQLKIDDDKLIKENMLKFYSLQTRDVLSVLCQKTKTKGLLRIKEGIGAADYPEYPEVKDLRSEIDANLITDEILGCLSEYEDSRHNYYRLLNNR